MKYHLHQLEFVQPLQPKRIGATIKQAHQLSDHLGDDHDLALLHEKIALHATQTPAETAATDALVMELKGLRAKLQRKSYRLGKKLCVLDYVKADKDPPYYTSQGTGDEEGEITFVFGNQESEYSLGNAVPLDEARKALTYFCETGELSDALSWEEV